MQLGYEIVTKYAIVAVYPDAEDSQAHETLYDDQDAAGAIACGLALKDARGKGGNRLVRNDQTTSIHDLETWCADAPVSAPIWAVRPVRWSIPCEAA